MRRIKLEGDAKMKLDYFAVFVLVILVLALVGLPLTFYFVTKQLTYLFEAFAFLIIPLLTLDKEYFLKREQEVD